MEKLVYMIKIPGRLDNLPHPHVDLSGDGAERILIPCFTAGGDELETHVTDEKNAGYPFHEIYVEADNSVCVRWKPGFTGTRSFWLVSRARRLPEDALGKAVGSLDTATVRKIALAAIARDER